MKKHKITILCILISFIIITFKLHEKYMTLYRPQNFLPPLSIMIDNTLYRLVSIPTDTSSIDIDIDITLTEPSGTINSIIKGELPTENGQINFGESGVEYWLVGPDFQDNNLDSDNLIYIKFNNGISVFKIYKWSIQTEIE